jgi:predicted extracellular nuclease
MRRSLITPALVAGALVVPGSAQAASPDIVISEVYGGGGNSGATLKNDYIELYNKGTTAVPVDGWSVQYASAAGTSWQVTKLGGSIEPGANYLVREAAGAGGTAELPDPDAAGSIPMSASNGKVALVRSSDECTGASCTGVDRVDFVGFGTANAFEGAAAAPGLTNTTSDSRRDGGALDTDQNGTDFTRGEPNPRNAKGQGPGTQEPEPGQPARNHDVQGDAHRSPLAGKQVEVPGVVTAISDSGYWIQDPAADADPNTSEGVFVFLDRRVQGLAEGDSVKVTGRVSEYRASSTALTLTEIVNSTFAKVDPLGTVEPTLVGPGGRVPPTEVIEDDPGNAETGEFEPDEDGIDWHETLEGMLVQIASPQAVGPTNGFGETATVPEGIGGPFTQRGGIYITPDDFNPERMIFDDVVAEVPDVNTGDAFKGPVDAVVDYAFNNYKYYPTATPKRIDRGLQREVTDPPRANQLAISSMNVENLDPGDPDEKFAELAQIAVENLRSPDILAVEEIQDNDGPGAAPTTKADVTYGKLIEAIEAIEAAGGPQYEFRQVDPNYDTDGGEPIGNIRVGFLYRTDRGLRFVDRPDATADTPNDVVKTRKGARLTYSPGRIDPTNPAFDDSRKPLAAEFLWKGRTVFAIANHFNSKGGDDPLFGWRQPPVQSSTTQRHKQARVVAGFVEKILAADPRAAIAVMGDFNDFQFSDTLGILEGAGLTNLMKTLPENEQYSYVFDGNSQVLDQILVSKELLTPEPEYDSVHVNAEFTDQASDHDPQVARVVVRGTGNANGQ